MSDFYCAAGLQFLVLLVLGLPVALMLTTTSRLSSPAWFLLAPALGTVVYLSVGTILHSIGLRSTSVFGGLIFVAAISACWLLYSAPSRLRRLLSTGVLLCLLAGIVSLVANSADFFAAGLDYFPLTNDDTFSYLGYIDQIRMRGWYEPRIAYAAGYFPLIEHAIYIRAPGVILAADLADVLRLESHASFFVIQRVALPIIALGAAGVVTLVTGSVAAALLCLASLTFGNSLLHQILQQFNSSTIGTIVAPVIVAMAIWTLRPERSDREFWAGSAMAGWASGTLAITSVEAHPFYLAAMAAMAPVVVFRDRNWRRIGAGLLAFFAGYTASSFPFISKIAMALVAQFGSVGAGHPGDWIASPGFLMQATGVTLTSSDKLSAYPLVPRLTAIAVFGSVATATIVLVWRAVSADKNSELRRSDLFSLACVALLLWLLQVILYARGSGYALLKVTDYFAFVGAITVAVASHQLGLVRSRMIGVLLFGFVGAYCVIACIEKLQVLDTYRNRTALLPLPAVYRIGEVAVGTTVTPDLSAEALNLFLYENRNDVTKIWFNAPESNRYRPTIAAPGPGPRVIARMPHAGSAETVVSDITYPGALTGSTMTIVPAIGQTKLILPDAHWLAPSLGSDGQPWRWLSESGGFTVYGPTPAGQRILRLDLAPGPDLHADNSIEVYVAGQRLLAIGVDQLPRRFEIPLSDLPLAENKGEIRITGPKAGIHQLSVANLVSDTH